MKLASVPSAIFFRPNISDRCCLCGSGENLSGEHKFKRSAISTEFGDTSMAISPFTNGESTLRTAQSAKSKRFYFQSKICSACNGARTQPADREFDTLHARGQALLQKGDDPFNAMSEEYYVIGSPAYLNIFRYFAKILCCHLAEVGAPRLLRMSRFAIGQIHRNCIWLKIDRDPLYNELVCSIERLQYAAHGGLVVMANRQTGSATEFRSTLTFGPLRYIFWIQITALERLALRFRYPQFDQFCKSQVLAAKENPISDFHRRHIGI